ncbi:MAG: ABC transporter ATP-binding protein [Polyangiales bacterium]
MPHPHSALSRPTHTVLEARGLSKTYGARKVLDQVSLRVARGEGVALLGPNGAGKSTLLLSIAGVLRVDAGVALVDGRSTSRAAGRRAVALVPQDAAVYDGLTAEENVTLFGRLHGMRGEVLQRARREALDAAALTQVATQRAGTYSGGMRRRLSLACALVHEPALLLLDEPFEGVDDASRLHLMDVLASAKERGVALMLGTHRLDEVGALCERACVLREGRVQGEYPIAGEPSATESAASARGSMMPSERETSRAAAGDER